MTISKYAFAFLAVAATSEAGAACTSSGCGLNGDSFAITVRSDSNAVANGYGGQGGAGGQGFGGTGGTGNGYGGSNNLRIDGSRALGLSFAGIRQAPAAASVLNRGGFDFFGFSVDFGQKPNDQYVGQQNAVDDNSTKNNLTTAIVTSGLQSNDPKRVATAYAIAMKKDKDVNEAVNSVVSSEGENNALIPFFSGASNAPVTTAAPMIVNPVTLVELPKATARKLAQKSGTAYGKAGEAGIPAALTAVPDCVAWKEVASYVCVDGKAKGRAFNIN